PIPLYTHDWQLHSFPLQSPGSGATTTQAGPVTDDAPPSLEEMVMNLPLNLFRMRMADVSVVLGFVQPGDHNLTKLKTLFTTIKAGNVYSVGLVHLSPPRGSYMPASLRGLELGVRTPNLAANFELWHQFSQLVTSRQPLSQRIPSSGSVLFRLG